MFKKNKPRSYDHLLTLFHLDHMLPTQFREPTAAPQRIIYLCLFPDPGHFWVTMKVCICFKRSELIMVFLSSFALRRYLFKSSFKEMA